MLFPPIPLMAWTALCLLMAGTPIAGAQDRFVRSTEPPVIACEPEKLDFGEVLSGEYLAKKILVKNMGKGDLDILKISFTCGCTIPQILMPSGEKVVPDKKGQTLIGTLKPGEVAEVSLEFKTLGLDGEAKRLMRIDSNDPLSRSYKIPIIAKVEPAFVFEPRRINFGFLRKGTTSTHKMRIRSTRAGPFRITGFTGLPPHFKLEVDHLKEGEVPCADVSLTLTEKTPVGAHALKIKCEVESEKIKEFDLHAFGEVLPPVRFETGVQGRRDTVDMGTLPRGQGTVKTVEVINEDPKVPYKITGMTLNSSHSDFLETELKTIEEGVHYKVLIRVKPEMDARFFNGEITLTSDHPDMKTKIIPFKGWILKK